MLDSKLLEIQKLQFSDKALAEVELHQFLRATEDSTIERVELNPKPESLNSINGFVTMASGERLFFKTHVEENEKVVEYYNAMMLSEAGYPVVSAKKVKTRPGTQIAFYEIITLPTLFDVVKEEEDSLLGQGNSPKLSPRAESLVRAQIDMDRKALAVYRRSIEPISEEKHAAAPVHQLFSHRLQPDGRVGIFYAGKDLVLDSKVIPFDSLAETRWIINGIEYDKTLSEIIAKAQKLTQPQDGLSVVGHGDAHNGNLFVDLDNKEQQLSFFDPAFAGRHHPLIDLTKPLFHNVFARWMYYPEQVNREVTLAFELRGNTISITHNFVPSLIRQKFLASRLENVLQPTLKLLEEHDGLPEDWREFLRAFLFCCPFLTVNLCAKPVANGTLAERYPPAIKLLGFCLAMEFASAPPARQKNDSGKGQLRSLVDSIFAA
jgi:hypothetical protein